MTNAPGLERDQPESRLHLRSIAVQIGALFLAFILFLVIMLPNQQKGLSFILLGLVILRCARSFLRENAIARHCATAIGTVTENTGYIPLVGPRGGRHHYKIRYRFVAGDGTVYHGGVRTGRPQPEQGQEIEVAYNRENPEKNMPRNLFWLYEKPRMFVP